MKAQFPRQKLRSVQKTPAWGKKHTDWADKIFSMKDSPIRASLKNRVDNCNLYLGNTSKDAYNVLLNPGQLQDFFVPENIQHYPIAKPYLNVLIGEESERRFEWKAVLTNPNAISQIEDNKKMMLKQRIAELTQNKTISQDEADEQLKKYIKYLKYDYQDIREKRANLLLNHFIKELDLKLKFNEGFKNVLLMGEEGYIGDVVNGRPMIELIDPKKVYVIKSGYSNRYEDADVIIMYDHWSPGKIIDTFYRFLKSKDITWLDKESSKQHSNGDGTDMDNDEHGINIARQQMIDDYISLPDAGGQKTDPAHSEIIDEYGNVRVIRVLWKSYKPILRVKYYDPMGDVQYRFESENYIADKASGEETEEYWVTEWWEGVKVGKDIYPYARPRKVQYNKFKDPGYNHPGIVGQMYNTGNMRVVSDMDTAKPYQYLYDATFHRMQDAMSKFFGSLVVVDKASLPDGWNITKWMYFAKKAGIAVQDSFKEGKKGAATGKLAASMTGNTGQVINQQLGDFIQQQVNILNYIEMQMGRILGVPPQRLGDINNRETVGGVERAVTQSSFITNEKFKIHDNVKKRVLTLLLEVTKAAMKENPEKYAHIGDDVTAMLFEEDDEMLEEEYGILVDNDTDITKLDQDINTLAQAAMQNQVLKFSDLIKLYSSSSISEKAKLIERGEEDMAERQEASAKRQEKMQAAMEEARKQEKLREEQIDLLKHKEDMNIRKYEIDKRHLAETMKIQHSDLMSDKDAEATMKQLDNDYEKIQKELANEMRELDEKIRSNKANESIAMKKIQVDKQQKAQKPTTTN
jgi:hypothetical protein